MRKISSSCLLDRKTTRGTSNHKVLLIRCPNFETLVDFTARLFIRRKSTLESIFFLSLHLTSRRLYYL